MDKEISSIRRVYDKDKLEENSLPRDPLQLFQSWFAAAIESPILDPTAFVLSTTDHSGNPDSRIVLLKDYGSEGFTFFTNYNSKKGKDLQHNPHVSVLFYWSEFERQIRIKGKVEKVSRTESENYFKQRPREAQIGAWCSSQSEPVASREQLDQRFQEFTTKFAEQDIPVPDFWGGYRLHPEYFEFWQGRPNRLHDRISYNLINNLWVMNRLNP